MNRKRLLVGVSCLLIVIVVMFFSLNIKDEKEKIFDYVIENEEAILSAVGEINQLSQNISFDYTETIVSVGNAEINEYADDVDGLYAEIKGLDGVRIVEIYSEPLQNVLNGKPVRDIGVEDGIIVFDCGGKGIAPSSKDYAFYYSIYDKPVAVFDGRIVCEPSQMVQKGNGYEYIDSGYNIFYTEKIKDNFYFCEAIF